MGDLLLLFFFIYLPGIIMAIANSLDKDDYKSGKQRPVKHRGIYNYTEPGNHEKSALGYIVLFFFALMFISFLLSFL